MSLSQQSQQNSILCFLYRVLPNYATYTFWGGGGGRVSQVQELAFQPFTLIITVYTYFPLKKIDDAIRFSVAILNFN